MGRSGTTLLWSSGVKGCAAAPGARPGAMRQSGQSTSEAAGRQRLPVRGGGARHARIEARSMGGVARQAPLRGRAGATRGIRGWDCALCGTVGKHQRLSGQAALLWMGCNHQGYRIKPHGQLVSVSLTHYCASTPDLSTSWS